MVMARKSIPAQVNEVTQFAAWLGGALLLLWIGKTLGDMEKYFIHSALETDAPRIRPAAVPQTFEGGVLIPWQDRHLVDPLPLPESALAVELLPAVETAPGEARVEALLKKLKDGVQRIQSSEEFRKYLITMSRFHEYSWNNQLLILLQKPNATRVAGFNTWKDLGRWVRKGETGIAIFAPILAAGEVRWVRPADGMTWRLQRIDKEWRLYQKDQLIGQFKTRREAERQLEEWGAVEERSGEAVTRFKVVYVFDISQTEGQPLPEYEVPVLSGEANAELFDRLKWLMKQRGVTVSFEPKPDLDPEIKGFFQRPAYIWVRPEEPPAQQLKTLIHEIGHYYTENVFRIPPADAETIAESVAFVVGAHYGFDTGVRSFPYVAIWAGKEKVLEQNLAAIRNITNAILEDLEKYGARK
jgi:hypothetical protein